MNKSKFTYDRFGWIRKIDEVLIINLDFLKVDTMRFKYVEVECTKLVCCRLTDILSISKVGTRERK
jgi:hypothetical protein